MKSIVLTIVLITGALTRQDARVVIDASIAELRRAGITLRVRELEMEDPCPHLSGMGDRAERLNCFEDVGIRGRAHFLAPAIRVDEKVFVAGLAAGHCRRGVSYSNVTMLNGNGEPRVYQSVIATTHEIAHLLGARHVPGGIMDVNAGALSLLGKLSWSWKSKKEMNLCLR